MSRATSLPRIQKILTQRGYTHPRVEGSDSSWKPGGGGEHWSKLLSATRGVAAAPMPADLEGTRLAADSLSGLGSRLERVMRGLEKVESSELSLLERRQIFDEAALLFEPFLVKLLAHLEPEQLAKLASKKTGPGLGTLMLLAARRNRSPVAREIVELAPSVFESPSGWDQRGTLGNALRDVFRVRIDVAHKAPDPTADELARLPWCVVVLLLAFIEKNLADLQSLEHGGGCGAGDPPLAPPPAAGQAKATPPPTPATKSKQRPKRLKAARRALTPGARELPPLHLSIRVPWHDAGWAGTVCEKPRENTACLALPRIATTRNDDSETRCAGQRWDTLAAHDLPACLAERASFMAPFDITRTIEHPYSKTSEKHHHFDPTPFTMSAYSAACVPFRWMLKSNVEGRRSRREIIEGLAERYQLGYKREREPDLGFESAWVQERDNQLVLLDTFFSAVRPEESFCFFYAKRTPLSEDNRRVLVGCGRVLGVGEPVEYRYTTSSPPLKCSIWERNILHSVRESSEDGFLLPYRELLQLADEDPTIRLEDFAAFAPDDHRLEFSYSSEHVSHDGAIASLLAFLPVIKKLGKLVPGPWAARALDWINDQLNVLWRMRGPCPGLGSALTAFGVTRGNLVAHAIAAHQARVGEENEDPWPVFEKLLADPGALGESISDYLSSSHRDVWTSLQQHDPQRAALLKLLSRFELSDAQATRYFQPTVRRKAGIDVGDGALIENPYLLYELDRTQEDPIALETIDRGLFPDEVVRERHPLPAPSALDGEIDHRRVRAFVVDTLERARAEGHTLLPRDWLVQRVRDRSIQPACPLSQDIISAFEETIAPVAQRTDMADGSPAYQLVELSVVGSAIRRAIARRVKGKRHTADHPWRKLVDAEFDRETSPKERKESDEEKARTEKAAVLAEIYSSRFSLLLGPAGTGKTKLLKILCSIPEVDRGGILFLAPTGKARVRIESQTERPGAKTIAQFLLSLGRYDAKTGRYHLAEGAPREDGYKTVVIDECSMMTEEQLAAVLEAIKGVDRLILVGDPRQLPPIGSGRPFVDTVRELAPKDIEACFPAVGPGYGELRIPRRQKGAKRDDLLLAHWFSGRPTDPGADEVWDRVAAGGVVSDHLELVAWNSPEELEERLFEKLEAELRVPDVADDAWFELSIGGSPYGDAVFFWAGKNGDRGAASRVDDWQILSPVRASRHGVEALNRRIQERFRQRAIRWSEPENWYRRKIPPRLGPQGIVYGDKVINVQNDYRDDVWPKPDERLFVANGELGVIVGEYKRRNMKFMPKHLEVEFWSAPGHAVKFKRHEFGDEMSSPLELAYALTVHKTQGSEFGTTFVILPNPCWLLCRELLYTALTRQKDKVVVFHQGQIRDFKRLASERDSDIARRMTNLFLPPEPIAIEKRFLERGLIHRTVRGELVRSKSEVIVADQLDALKIDYEYEKELIGADGSRRYPDFTIEDSESGERIYWEHLGLLHDESYRQRWEEKLKWYRALGVLPFGEGGGPNGVLVWSEDQPNGGINAAALKQQMREVFDV